MKKLILSGMVLLMLTGCVGTGYNFNRPYQPTRPEFVCFQSYDVSYLICRRMDISGSRWYRNQYYSQDIYRRLFAPPRRNPPRTEWVTPERNDRGTAKPREGNTGGRVTPEGYKRQEERVTEPREVRPRQNGSDIIK